MTKKKETLVVKEEPTDVKNEIGETAPVPTISEIPKEFGDLSPFLQAYYKQNPDKFRIKWENGELKGL